MSGNSHLQVIDMLSANETHFSPKPKRLDFVRARDLPAQARSTLPKIVQASVWTGPDKAVNRGKWTLYFLCRHCETEWFNRSDAAEAISQCPVCSTHAAAYERE